MKNERDLKWRAPNGFQHQETYDKEWIRIRDEFFSNTVFGNVDVDTREERATPNEYPLKNEKGVVIIENAACDLSGQPTEEGLWYKGPVRAVRYGLCDICSSPACGCLPRVEPLICICTLSHCRYGLWDEDVGKQKMDEYKAAKEAGKDVSVIECLLYVTL